MDNKTKNYLLGGLAGLVLVVLMFIVAGGSNNNVADQVTENNQTSTTTTTTPKPSTSGSVASKPKPPVVDSFTNIFPQRGNFKCTYEEVTPSTRSTNVIYFSNGKMRAEFRTFSGASNIMVYDGVYKYTWVEGQSVGVMTKPTSISDFPAIIPKDINEGVVLGAGLNNASWLCHAWSADQALVNKPTYVKF